MSIKDLAELPLPPGIRSRLVPGINGLTMHVLEAGDEGSPGLLLLHGFPELAYSWRKVMLPLAAAGFHIIAPDQRGYGRTTGWDPDYDGDLDSFRILNLARDTLGLISSLGYRFVAAVIGHDFGSPVAANCALIRPDVFRRLALMSAPYAGPPNLFASGEFKIHAPARRAARSLTSLRGLSGRASITSATTNHPRRTRICGTHGMGCTPSCAATIISRARTGQRTGRSR